MFGFFLLCSVLSLDYHQANISHPHITQPPNFATLCCLFSLKINKLNPFFSHSLHKTFFLCLLTRAFFLVGVLVWFLCLSPPQNLSEHNTYFIHNLLVMVLSMEIYVLLFLFILLFFCFFFWYFLLRRKGCEEERGMYCVCCIVVLCMC